MLKGRFINKSCAEVIKLSFSKGIVNINYKYVYIYKNFKFNPYEYKHSELERFWILLICSNEEVRQNVSHVFRIQLMNFAEFCSTSVRC